MTTQMPEIRHALNDNGELKDTKISNVHDTMISTSTMDEEKPTTKASGDDDLV
jgi:hypothetical protein